MSYDSAETGYVESLHLSFDDAGHTDLYRKVYVFEYGETGYEGSHHNLISSVTDEQVTAFGELFAEALGDTPETPQMAFERRLDEIRASCATNEAKDAVEYLLSRAWPAQALSIVQREVLQDGTPLYIAIAQPENSSEAAAFIRVSADKFHKRG